MLSTWDAVSTLDRLMDDVMGSAVGTATTSRTFQPALDIRTTADDVTVVCDLPGVRAEDLEITLDQHVLTIRGTRKFERKDGEHVVLGRAYGTFSRAISLPDGIDEEQLSAQLTDGVLTVRVQMHPKAKPRRIKIANGNGDGTANGPKQIEE